MKKTALMLMIVAILSKIIGLFRDIILAYFYGASSISDAYIVALTIPGVIFSFIGIAITTGFIPMYTEIVNKKGEAAGVNYTNNLINLLLVFCSIIVIVTFIFTEKIVLLFASGFESETLFMAIILTRFLVLGIYFTGIVYIFGGYLNYSRKFLIPSLIGLPLNVIFIISIVSSSLTNNIYFLGLGSVLAYASQVILLVPFCYKQGFKYKFIINLKDKYLRKMIYLAIPVILGTSINQINILVDRTLASQIAVGGISALNYADKLNHFVQGIFVTSIATIIFPSMSSMSVEKNLVGLKKVLQEAITSINILVIPSTVGLMVFASQVIDLLFGRGAFDSIAISTTANVLFFYSIGMVAFGLRQVISKVFYSMQDSKTPMINGVAGVTLNIILNFILSHYLGLPGLALATSIAAIFTTTLLLISLRKKIGPFGMKQISISFLKILFASLVMGGLAKLSFNYLTASLSQNLSLLIAIGVGAVSYFVIIYFMKIEDVDVIVGAIKKKLGRGAA